MRSQESSLKGFEYHSSSVSDPFPSQQSYYPCVTNYGVLTGVLVNECAETGSNAICSAADNYCADNVESVYDEVLNRDEYDIREVQPDP